MRLISYFINFLQKSKEWAFGRSWHLRLLLWLYLFYIFIRHTINPDYTSIFAPLNLCFHELGHLVFALFGNFICTLGGSFLQCLIPVIGIIMFYHQRDFFAISVALVWLATNFYNVATYIADARAMALPLVTLFGITGDVVHDWNYILEKLGLLQFDTTIAFLVRILGFSLMLTGVVYGGWLILEMIRKRTTTMDVSPRHIVN